MITKEQFDLYTRILKEELVPAMGCTEPIAIAYATAKARAVLGDIPVSAKVEVSGNIVKNAKSVTVPHTGGMRGIKSAFIAGLVAGNADAELEVISKVTPAQIEEMKVVVDTFEVEIVASIVPGDANGDGKVNSGDAVDILRKLAGYEVPSFNEAAADFNGDGKVNSGDAVDILRKLAGY